MDVADTKEVLPRETSAADVAEETKADVEAVKSVEDASYPIIACGLFFGVVIFPGLLAAAGEENEN